MEKKAIRQVGLDAELCRFFFLEQRRRTARHFIKVENRYTGPRDPTPTHTPHNSHTLTHTVLWIYLITTTRT